MMTTLLIHDFLADIGIDSSKHVLTHYIYFLADPKQVKGESTEERRRLGS